MYIFRLLTQYLKECKIYLLTYMYYFFLNQKILIFLSIQFRLGKLCFHPHIFERARSKSKNWRWSKDFIIGIQFQYIRRHWGTHTNIHYPFYWHNFPIIWRHYSQVNLGYPQLDETRCIRIVEADEHVNRCLCKCLRHEKIQAVMKPNNDDQYIIFWNPKSRTIGVSKNGDIHHPLLMWTDPNNMSVISRIHYAGFSTGIHELDEYANIISRGVEVTGKWVVSIYKTR